MYPDSKVANIEEMFETLPSRLGRQSSQWAKQMLPLWARGLILSLNYKPKWRRQSLSWYGKHLLWRHGLKKTFQTVKGAEVLRKELICPHRDSADL